ncbi:hypothetical protein NEOC84_001904|nr:hypothetical protein [Neochlamydia sp. AcF84]
MDIPRKQLRAIAALIGLKMPRACKAAFKLIDIKNKQRLKKFILNLPSSFLHVLYPLKNFFGLKIGFEKELLKVDGQA